MRCMPTKNRCRRCRSARARDSRLRGRGLPLRRCQRERRATPWQEPSGALRGLDHARDEPTSRVDDVQDDIGSIPGSRPTSYEKEQRRGAARGRLWIPGALSRADRRVPLTNLYSLRWPGTGSNRRPSDFQKATNRSTHPNQAHPASQNDQPGPSHTTTQHPVRALAVPGTIGDQCKRLYV